MALSRVPIELVEDVMKWKLKAHFPHAQDGVPDHKPYYEGEPHRLAQRSSDSSAAAPNLWSLQQCYLECS
jgi:hypothetical protein